MCGIAGFNFRDDQLIKKMLSVQAHRGPDCSMSYSDDQISIGHNRLSIIDLSENGIQPMWDSDNHYAIVFNGEIYNFKTIKEELSKKYIFKSGTDTEVVLFGYKEYGDKIFGMLEGMWSLAIYDKIKKELIISRDYAGIKPLFYSLTDKRLIFASEMKTLLASGYSFEVDEGSITTFLSFGFIPSPFSIYKNVKKVMPGEIIHFLLDDLSIRKNKLFIIKDDLNNEEDSFLIKKGKEIIFQSVERHLMSDVPIGLFMSGGIDSSLIAVALKDLGIDIPFFCLDIDGRKDAYYAKEIAKRIGSKIEILKVDPKSFEDVYEKIFDSIKEPLADTAIFTSYLLSSLAKGKVKVVLSGEGGDELFGGYFTHKHLSSIKKPKWKISNRVDILLKTTPNFRGKKIIADWIYAKERDALGLYLNNLSTAYLYDYNVARKYFNKLEFISPFLYDLNSYLPDRLLSKLDSTTMFFSLEGRVPFLDKKLIQFATSDKVKKYSMENPGKHMLKTILSAYLPKELINRPKEGFSAPMGLYFSKMPIFQSDYKKSLKWLKDNFDMTKTQVERAGKKTPYNLVSLYRALL